MEGTANREYEFPLVHLPPGSVKTLSSDVRRAIDEFQPLDYEPGHEAANWLRVNVDTGSLPLDTFLVLNEGSTELLGFFVLEAMQVRVARGDFPVIQVRTGLADEDERVKATKLVWIVRAANNPKGFGEELFDEVLVRAVESSAVAVLVEPYDEATASRLWIDHFHCRQQRRNADHPDDWGGFHWYPLGMPDQTFG